ncbi:MAG: hypothetical protein ACKVRN_09470 [Pyrinomonadaceae bacterium]
MSNKTIAKFYAFVILVVPIAAFFSACTSELSSSGQTVSQSSYHPPKVNGIIKSPDIEESSGIAASRCQSNVLWTHNDSDDGPFIYALNDTGESLGTWKVTGAQNIDWEDIAAYKDRGGKCYIYIGEIGDNKQKRLEHTVYRIKEPIISQANSTSNRKAPLETEQAEIVRFRYPDFNQDAETLMVHPQTGDIYVATKRIMGPSGIYRLKSSAAFVGGDVVKLDKVAELSVPAIPDGLLSGGDISPDGKRVIVCDYGQAYEYTLTEADPTFDSIWLKKPEPVELGERKNGESVCYNVDGTSIFATSEGKKSPVIEVKRK